MVFSVNRIDLLGLLIIASKIVCLIIINTRKILVGVLVYILHKST